MQAYLNKEREELLKQLDALQEERGGILTMDEVRAFLLKRIEDLENSEKKRQKIFRKRIPRELCRGDGILLFEQREEEKEAYMQLQKENAIYFSDRASSSVREQLWAEMQNGNAYYCSILREEDGVFLGYVSIHDRSRALWEIGIELLQEYQSQGYGEKALRLFLLSIARKWGRTEFQARVEPANEKSRRLMEKLGASLVGLEGYRSFDFTEEELHALEEQYLDQIDASMLELAKRLQAEPRKLLSHALDYRFYVENGEIRKETP